MSPPWTPLPLRLGAYSAKSTERSHSITRWLVHCWTSDGVTVFCGNKPHQELQLLTVDSKCKPVRSV